MKKTGKVVQNDNLVRDIHKMTFDMGECDFRLPGQYAMIEAGGVRRPYQVCDFDSNRFTVVFPADGKESKILASLGPGEEVTVTMGLGNGFDLDAWPFAGTPGSRHKMQAYPQLSKQKRYLYARIVQTPGERDRSTDPGRQQRQGRKCFGCGQTRAVYLCRRLT